MKTFNWNEDKNRWLKQERGVSFEQVVFCIESGKILDIIKHPNPEKYPNQQFYVIDINSYVFIVPYVEPRQRAHSSPLAAGLASELEIEFHPYGEDSPRLAAGRFQNVNVIFLKTVFPSRKYTKLYLGLGGQS